MELLKIQYHFSKDKALTKILLTKLARDLEIMVKVLIIDNLKTSLNIKVNLV